MSETSDFKRKPAVYEVFVVYNCPKGWGPRDGWECTNELLKIGGRGPYTCLDYTTYDSCWNVNCDNEGIVKEIRLKTPASPTED